MHCKIQRNNNKREGKEKEGGEEGKERNLKGLNNQWR